MTYYDFAKKESVDVLATITHFVNHNHTLELSISPKDCKVVNLFNDNSLFVAKPIEVLGRVIIKDFYPNGTGKLYIGSNVHRFSIHDTVMYIGGSNY